MCHWNDPNADAVELFIPGSKTDQRQQGCKRLHHASGDSVLCPVKLLAEWFRLTNGASIPPSAPLFSIPQGTLGLEWTVVKRESIALIIKSAAAECRIPTKMASTHSIRISGATALLLAGVAAETVQLIGRWISNAFMGYTRYKSEIMGGIASSMIHTKFGVQSS